MTKKGKAAAAAASGEIKLREMSPEEVAGEDAAILAEAQHQHALDEAPDDPEELQAAADIYDKLMRESEDEPNPLLDEAERVLTANATDEQVAAAIIAEAESLVNVEYMGVQMSVTTAVARLISDAADTLEAPKMSLREVAQHMFALDCILTALEGELPPELEALQAQLFEAVTGKIDRTLDYLQSLYDDADVCKKEKIRLGARQKSLETRAENLEKYILMALQMSGRDEIEGVLHDGVKLHNKPAQLKIIDRQAIDPRYIEHIVPVAPAPYDAVREDAMFADLKANEATLAAHAKAMKAYEKLLKKDPSAIMPPEPVLIEVPGAELLREKRLAWK